MKTVPNPADLSDAEIEGHLREARRMENAPEHVIQRAMAVWQPRRQAAPDAPGLMQRLLAVLTFDSAGASPLAFGARSTGGAPRQMLFSAEGHDIDLRIRPAEQAEHWLLSGQVLGPEAKGMVLVADANGQLLGESALSELGEFLLPAVAAGRYTVSLRIGEREIELPAVYVPQAI